MSGNEVGKSQLDADVTSAVPPPASSRPDLSTRGRLHVFLGAAPGAGKTYAMLARARELADAGTDVVIGLAETHGRADTDAMAAALEQIPQRSVSHSGTTFTELDVPALLDRHPAVVIVDELAHSCVPGSEH